jgi:hypothetical protein
MTEQMTTSFVPVQITYATRQKKNIRALASKLVTGTLKSPNALKKLAFDALMLHRPLMRMIATKILLTHIHVLLFFTLIYSIVCACVL